MTATYSDLKRWIDEAKQKGATHLIVAVDRFKHDNYPLFVLPGENVHAIVGRLLSESMQGYDEIYSFTGKHDLDKQLGERRAIHLD